MQHIAPSSGAPEWRNSARWLVAGTAFFIAVKLLWVLLPAAVMGLPRLGDDALVYLWKSASTVLEDRSAAPAIQDIDRLRAAPAQTPELEFNKARVTMRTTGATASPVALLTGQLVRFGWSPKAAFAAMEAVIAICLGLAMAFFLHGLVGNVGAGCALAVLAVAILPNQGLQYMIASVMVLAMGLVLWALLLHGGRRAVLAPPVAVLMLFTHPIGPLYVLVGVALVMGKALVRHRKPAHTALQVGLLALSVPVWRLIESAMGAHEPRTGGLGGFSLDTVPANVKGLQHHVQTLVLTQPVIFILLVTGLVLAVRRWRENMNAALLAVVLTGVVLSTVIVDLPGYPGELPSRALVALVIVSAGLSAAWLGQLLARFADGRSWLLAGLVVIILTQVPLFVHEAFANINSRHQIYDPILLRQEVAELPPGATIVWPDTDIALMAGLLAGADRLHAVPYRMLSGPADLKAATAGASEIFVAAAAPERLNGLSTVGAWSLQPRYHGYGFDHFRQVNLEAPPGTRMPGFLRLEGASASTANVSDGSRTCDLVVARAEEPGWYKVEGCGPNGILRVESEEKALRLTGLSMAQPDVRRPWPWGQEGLRLKAQPRDSAEAAELLFDLAYLLGPFAAAGLQSELGPWTLVSSRSGIVWLRAGVSTGKEQ